MIKLNKKFYDVDAINKTIKAFSNICKCNVKLDKNYFCISIIPNDNDMVNVDFEFANYVFSLMR